MNSFWDHRYDTAHFVYGKEPNVFFASRLQQYDPGKLLLPGEGEGRNAVHAAKNGWTVDAFDQSRVGSEKALSFAREQGVEINYLVAELEHYPFPHNYYDAAGLIYFHAAPSMRKRLHGKVCGALKPGGVVILEGFHTSQLGMASGGPQSPDLLFNGDLILADFSALEPLYMEELTIALDEGTFHRGEARIVRYIGKKNNS